MQQTILTVAIENGKLLSDKGLIPPSAVALGCETTSRDPYGCIWDYPDNCVLSVLRTEVVKMVKQHKKYYVISGTDSTSKFVFEFRNNPQKHCGQPTPGVLNWRPAIFSGPRRISIKVVIAVEFRKTTFR